MYDTSGKVIFCLVVETIYFCFMITCIPVPGTRYSVYGTVTALGYVTWTVCSIPNTRSLIIAEIRPKLIFSASKDLSGNLLKCTVAKKAGTPDAGSSTNLPDQMSLYYTVRYTK